MSLVRTEITLKNLEDVMTVRRGFTPGQEIRQTTVQALVDTGAWTLAIDEATREKLGLPVVKTETGTFVDGSVGVYKMAGPVEVGWKDRSMVCDALVIPGADEVLLGAIPLEAMDLMVDTRGEKVVGAHGDVVMHTIK